MDPILIDSTTLYDSPRFRLDQERFQIGETKLLRPVIHHPGSVVILALEGPDRLVMERQWRYALRAWTLELPAGTMEADEDPLLCARRELTEETGFVATTWRHLMNFFPAPGVSDECMHLYVATDLQKSQTDPDEGELIQTEIMDRAQILNLVRRGELQDGKTLIGLAALGWWGG
jgi:ADP-ribose pyrophosphatase